MFKEFLLLDTLYDELLSSQSNKVSLIRLQTGYNNHKVHKFIRLDDIKINEILGMIKEMFPNQTSLNDGQITFYHLQINEIQNKILDVFDRCQADLVRKVQRTDEELKRWKQGQGKIDEMKLRRGKILAMYRDTVIAKLESFDNFKDVFGSFQDINKDNVSLHENDLKKLKSLDLNNLIDLQWHLQSCLTNGIMCLPHDNRVLLAQDELDMTINFVRDAMDN